MYFANLLMMFSGIFVMRSGIMFVLFASPTAIVSFIMAEAMGANSKLAGNIVLISTVASVFTIAAGIVILKELALI